MISQLASPERAVHPLPLAALLAGYLLFGSTSLAAEVDSGAVASKHAADYDHYLQQIEYRNLGPYRTGAWVADFAVPENGREHLYTWYVGMRSGGVWKTDNNGVTFKPVFDGNGVQAIGALAVAPSDNDTVWVGTGGNDAARSSRAGRGVWKSVDGGKSWSHMGLADSQHVARIVVHPDDQNTVYVAAMGHLFSRNSERGLFRTRDGGETWEKVLYIADDVGVVDVVLQRNNPEIMLAATYQMARYPWHFEAGGEASGIYRSTDGGSNWERSNAGLPGGPLGRIGLDVYRRDGNIAYAVIENLNERAATEAEIAAATEAGKPVGKYFVGGEVYRSNDGGLSWQRTHDPQQEIGGKAPYSFNQIFVDPNDPERIFVTSVYLASSTDGGKTWRDLDRPETLFSNNFGDVRTFWIDPRDSRRMLFGSDGGVYVSYDGGETSDHLYNLPTGEIYAVGLDMADPYNIYLGLQDHESWKGPVNSWSGAVTLEDWVLVGLWDGMYNQVDPTDNRYLYTTAQFGGHRRVDQVNGTRADIEPKRDQDERRRFPWTPAIQVSPHNPSVIFAGAEQVMRSDDRGSSWHAISPDLTHATPVADGGRCVDAGGAQGWINFCTVTTLQESSLQAGLIWAGTDDGRVHHTADGGRHWEDVTARLKRAGAVEDFWVTRVHTSSHDPDTAYVTKSGRRFDQLAAQVFRTRDAGKSWQSISGNLPDSPVNVIVEDKQNPDLLFLGNELGVYVSVDGGRRWNTLRGNMPVVPVTDLAVHPRENDLVVATYGRGAYVTDISVLREIAGTLQRDSVHLFAVEDNVIQRSERADWGAYHMLGDRHLATPNEAAGFTLDYFLPGDVPGGEITLSFYNPDASVQATMTAPGIAGLHRVQWDTAAISGIVPGRYQIKLEAGAEVRMTEAELKPPRAFAIGQSGQAPD